MLSVLLKWRRKKGTFPTIPVHLECSCGKVLAGKRGPECQTFCCSKCGARHFIFPTSPLLFMRNARSRSRLFTRPAKIADKSSAPAKDTHFWRAPIWAALVAVAILIPVLIWLLQSSLFRSGPSSSKTDEDGAVEEYVREGRRALSDGLYTKANEHFREAKQHARPGDVAYLNQLENEANLMNDLVSESIPEILRQSIGATDKAWQERFRSRYRHQSIMFDASVQSAPEGYRIDYLLMLGDTPIRIDLGNQSTLAQLSLDEPRRLLFGFRMAETKLVRGGWVVAAEPDSVVLITESAALKGASVPVDGELSHLLAEQARMLQRIRGKDGK
jgi:hypothetical protein